MPNHPRHIVIDGRNRRSSTGRYTDCLIDSLQEADKDNFYTILVELGDDWVPTNPNFKTEPCRFAQFSFNPIDQIAFSRQLYKLKPDLVHFTMTQQPLFYFGNIVTTTHDLTMLLYTRPSRFPRWLHNIGMTLYRFLFWFAHKKSKKIIVPSKYVAGDLAKLQPFTNKKTKVIYEASEPPISASAEPVAGIKEPFIFHVGAPYPHKNIDRLIKAFGLLKESQPNLQLVLPGKIHGQFKKDFNSWVTASPVKESIVTPGFISDAQLKWLYENAQCYVLPSLSEGFGLPGLEAMAHGCPVAASNATCLPEIYGDGALYFDPKNEREMAEKINNLISDKKLREKQLAKSEKQLRKYSWQKTAQETLRIYSQLL